MVAIYVNQNYANESVVLKKFFSNGFGGFMFICKTSDAAMHINAQLHFFCEMNQVFIV